MGNQSNSLTSLALQKFKKNFWGVFSLGIIACIGLVSVFAYVFAPDASKNANQMHLSIHSKPPGFNSLMPHAISEIYKVYRRLLNIKAPR